MSCAPKHTRQILIRVSIGWGGEAVSMAQRRSVVRVNERRRAKGIDKETESSYICSKKMKEREKEKWQTQVDRCSVRFGEKRQ